MVAIVSSPLFPRAAPITSSMAVVRPETVASMRDARRAASPIFPVPLINGYDEIVRWEEAKEHRLARDLFISRLRLRSSHGVPGPERANIGSSNPLRRLQAPAPNVLRLPPGFQESFRDSGGIIVVAKGGLIRNAIIFELVKQYVSILDLVLSFRYLAGIALRARRGPNDNTKAAIVMRHWTP
ncbi:hypothetical protein [Bradyrhizobium sp. LMG 9283]|uniref:hypothetical protein n=1 Tax=Bradyrhizobium sp. LMG 9283 TaxID=592064 RepID=UPI00388FFA66